MQRIQRSMTILDVFDDVFKCWQTANDDKEFSGYAEFAVLECLKRRECSITEIRMGFSHWKAAKYSIPHFVGFVHSMPLIFNRIEKMGKISSF